MAAKLRASLEAAGSYDDPRFLATVLAAEQVAESMDDLREAAKYSEFGMPIDQFDKLARLLMRYLDALHLTPKAVASLNPGGGGEDDDPAASELAQMGAKRRRRTG